MWRSLVAHLTGGQGVAGSNPVIPTMFVMFALLGRVVALPPGFDVHGAVVDGILA